VAPPSQNRLRLILLPEGSTPSPSARIFQHGAGREPAISDRHLGPVEAGEGEAGVVLVVEVRLVGQQTYRDRLANNIPCTMSWRQWIPAIARPIPTFDASLFNSPPTVILPASEPV